MNEAWKNLDLEGEGLQTLSLRLSQQLKQRTRAYRLLLLFPLGLHRAYLDDNRGAWAYRLAFVLAVSAWLLRRPCIGFSIILLMTGFAVYDIRWVEDRIARLNKAIRMAAWRSRPATAPAGFRGRYTDDSPDEAGQTDNASATPDDWIRLKESERGGHVQPGRDPAYNSRMRAPSIAQQEALLRELARKRPDNDKTS